VQLGGEVATAVGVGVGEVRAISELVPQALPASTAIMASVRARMVIRTSTVSAGYLDISVIDAVIFDLDGTLVDTVGTRIAAWLRTFEEEGIPADRAQVAGLIGSDGRRLATAALG
jgi:hypothetical protein